MWNDMAEKNEQGLSEEENKKFIVCANSYLGIMKHYDTYRLRKKTIANLSEKILANVIFSENFEKVGLVGC
jgi:hypothetical protein